MLNELHIENIAVIERADISFGRGLNVLTGETGAGKSIVIDSIGAVLGDRVSRELVRRGADKGLVTAAFDVDGCEQTPMMSLSSSAASQRTGKAAAVSAVRQLRRHSSRSLPRCLWISTGRTTVASLWMSAATANISTASAIIRTR